MKDEAGKGVSAVAADKPIYHLENHKGEKCFYDSKREVYFFKTVDVGYPIWINVEHIRLFVKEMKFQQSQIFMVKHLGKSETEKKLIQVYGTKKNSDGTMGEPEHIEINEEATEIN